ncbi:MAG: hypothetical protein WCJ95_21960, partial [Mariniphaga sp.]
ENMVKVKYGWLMLQQIQLSIPKGHIPKSVKVYRNNIEIPSTYEAKNRIEISFDRILLNEGDELKIVFS